MIIIKKKLDDKYIMPFTIIKTGDRYQLRNQTTGRVLKKKFRTRDAAAASSASYMKNKRKAKDKKKSDDTKKKKSNY